VLGTLLKNKLIPDPFYGLNNESIIDIAKSGRGHYTFWFFTTFQCAPVRNHTLSRTDFFFRAAVVNSSVPSTMPVL
jgi:mannosylglycoprotein endo-beta-mannosidase